MFNLLTHPFFPYVVITLAIVVGSLFLILSVRAEKQQCWRPGDNQFGGRYYNSWVKNPVTSPKQNYQAPAPQAQSRPLQKLNPIIALADLPAPLYLSRADEAQDNTESPSVPSVNGLSLQPGSLGVLSPDTPFFPGRVVINGTNHDGLTFRGLIDELRKLSGPKNVDIMLKITAETACANTPFAAVGG